MSDKKNQTDLLKLQISLSIWNVTDGFSRPTVYVFLTVFQHILYVCLSVCVWLWQGSFQTPQTLMNGSLYVRACVLTVCVWSTVTFAHSFSHQCKIFSPSEYWSFLSSLHHPTNTQTTCSRPDVALLQYPHSFHANCVIHQSLLFHLLDVPTPVMPWIISDPEHHQPPVHFRDSHPPTSGNLLSLQTRDHD